MMLKVPLEAFEGPYIYIYIPIIYYSYIREICGKKRLYYTYKHKLALIKDLNRDKMLLDVIAGILYRHYILC